MRDAPSRLAVVAAAAAWSLPHPASAAFFRPSALGFGRCRRRIPTPTRDATDDDICHYLSMARDGGDRRDRAASSPSPARTPGVVFPGGGLFFYWQAGVVAHLQESGYDLPSAPLSGASAGALSATLAKSGVSPYDATELALAMSEEAGIWDRPAGLQGIWGGIIREWLDVLLPDDAGEGAQDELHILLTPVPSFGKSRISRFENRRDLIDANMASVHLPWFLDGKLTSDFRGKPHIDGSVFAQPSDYFSGEMSETPRLILDYKRDPVMKERSSEFVKLISKRGIWDILEQGKKHAMVMDRRGEFDLLPRR